MKHLISIAITTFLGLSAAQAHLALRGKNFAPSAAERSISSPSKDLNLLNRKFLKDNGKKYQLDTTDVALVVPTNMAATNNSQVVQERILDKTIRSVFDSKYIKNSSLGQTYKKVKDSANLDLTIKEKTSKLDPKKAPVQHKFKFDYQVLEANALLSYSGYFDTSVRYLAQTQQMVISFSEKIGNSSSINLTHDKVPTGSTQWVHFNTSW